MLILRYWRLYGVDPFLLYQHNIPPLRIFMSKKTESAAEGTVSKMEAVRQTLAAGIDKPQDGVDHIKEKFGLDVPTAIFSSYKSAINSKKSKRGRNGKAGASGVEVSSKGSFNANGIQLAQEVKALVGKYGAEAVKGMADVFAD